MEKKAMIRDVVVGVVGALIGSLLMWLVSGLSDAEKTVLANRLRDDETFQRNMLEKIKGSYAEEVDRIREEVRLTLSSDEILSAEEKGKLALEIQNNKTFQQGVLNRLQVSFKEDFQNLSSTPSAKRILELLQVSETGKLIIKGDVVVREGSFSLVGPNNVELVKLEPGENPVGPMGQIVVAGPAASTATLRSYALNIGFGGGSFAMMEANSTVGGRVLLWDPSGQSIIGQLGK